MSDSREKIIREAIRLFARDGFAKTSVQAIADRSGVSQTNVLYHFRTKEGLVEGVIEYIAKHNHEVVLRNQRMEDDARERLKKHFEGNLEWGVRHKDEAQILILLYYMGTFNQQFSSLYLGLQKTARERIETLLHAGLREGLFNFRLRPSQMSELLHDTLVGGFINLLSVPHSKSAAAELKQKWECLFERLLGRV